MPQLTYIVSPVTFYDTDKELYYTEIAVDQRQMPLHYTVWGKTENESREKAIRLAEILTKD